MKIASFFPGQAQSTFYAMAGDDCSLFFDLDNLTEKQAADHLANIELTGLLQVALIALGKASDHVAIYEQFREEPWAAMLQRYRRQFLAAGFETIPPEHISFGRKLDFYASIAGQVPAVDLVSLYMVSGSNAVLHRSPERLAISRKLNSKFHFAANAPQYGIPVPETFVTTKAGLTGAEASAFLERNLAADGAIMLKISGLAGARNVTSVTSLAEAQAYVAQYADDMAVLLQKKLDLSRFTEMTVDLFVSDREVRIANFRQLLFANGLWVGNFIPAQATLTADQEAQLIKVGEYAHHHGLGDPEGNNCGIDFFVGPQGEIVVTEINVRWTGGLFPAEAVRIINGGSSDAVVCIDVVPLAETGAYLDFVEAHLPSRAKGEFSCVSLGFSPFVQHLDGVENILVWHLVLGDFTAFHAAKTAQLAKGVLPTTDLIVLPD
jgi:hypothetical protein